MVPLPKIELHLHLEGSFRPATVPALSIGRSDWLEPYDDGWEHRYFTFSDFDGFMRKLGTPRMPGTPQEYRRVALECFEDLARQNVVYAEVSFDLPTRAVGDDSRFWPVVEALEEARRLAERTWPIHLTYIAGLMRTLPPEVVEYRVQLAIAARERGIALLGVDLHGDERLGPASSFTRAYAMAADAGMGLRAHAGEAAGPESVRDALDLLRVHRIGHGIRSLEDQTLLDRLRQGAVTLDICPTSNVRTRAAPTIQAHPIRALYDLGVPVTVSSDDPLPFFTNIEREYRLLVDELGFTREDLRAITLQAARASFLPVGEQKTLSTLVEGAYRPAVIPITAR